MFPFQAACSHMQICRPARPHLGAPTCDLPLSSILVPHNLQRIRRTPPGQPIYAISGRLLAFASPPQYPSASATSSSRRPQSQMQPYDRPSSGFGMHITRADLGNAALKVGGTVLSGMKSLGEKAYSAALSRAGLAMDSMSGPSVKGLLGQRGEDGGLARFFLRSAPAAAIDHHERRYSTSSNVTSNSGQTRTTAWSISS